MNRYLLEYKIKELGFRVPEYAERLGMNKATFFHKRTGRTEFTRKEMALIKQDLKLTDQELIDIFFD